MLLSGEWSQRELGIIQELLKNNRPWNCTWFCLVFIIADSPVDKYNIYTDTEKRWLVPSVWPTFKDGQGSE